MSLSYANNNKSKALGDIRVNSIKEGPLGTAGWIEFTPNLSSTFAFPTDVALESRYKIEGDLMTIIFAAGSETGTGGVAGSTVFRLDLPGNFKHVVNDIALTLGSATVSSTSSLVASVISDGDQRITFVNPSTGQLDHTDIDMTAAFLIAFTAQMRIR